MKLDAGSSPAGSTAAPAAGGAPAPLSVAAVLDGIPRFSFEAVEDAKKDCVLRRQDDADGRYVFYEDAVRGAAEAVRFSASNERAKWEPWVLHWELRAREYLPRIYKAEDERDALRLQVEASRSALEFVDGIAAKPCIHVGFEDTPPAGCGRCEPCRARKVKAQVEAAAKEQK